MLGGTARPRGGWRSSRRMLAAAAPAAWRLGGCQGCSGAHSLHGGAGRPFRCAEGRPAGRLLSSRVQRGSWLRAAAARALRWKPAPDAAAWSPEPWTFLSGAHARFPRPVAPHSVSRARPPRTVPAHGCARIPHAVARPRSRLPVPIARTRRRTLGCPHTVARTRLPGGAAPHTVPAHGPAHGGPVSGGERKGTNPHRLSPAPLELAIGHEPGTKSVCVWWARISPRADLPQLPIAKGPGESHLCSILMLHG